MNSATEAVMEVLVNLVVYGGGLLFTSFLVKQYDKYVQNKYKK